ncbi:MAG: DUF3488 domain-containing protein [Phycisphaerae bacterium]|nr:DUF3488 domain-containing protein [Phycisphaerae bacterium]
MPLSSFTPAEIELTERRRLEQPLLLLVWLSTATFSFVEGNMFYVLSCTLAVGVNFIAVRRHKEVFVSKILVNIGVLLSAGLVLLEFRIGDQSSLIPFGHFMVLMQLCKLFEKKRNRDYMQLLMLSFVQMIITAMLSLELWFALVLMVYLVLLSYVTMILTIKRGLDRAAKTKLTSESGPLAPKRVAWNVIRRWPGRAIFNMTSRVLIPALIVGILAFLLIPRVSKGLMQILGDTGLFLTQDTSMKLGGDKDLYASPRLMMRVKIFRNDKPTPAPCPELTYLRGNILASYADSQWNSVSLNTHPYAYNLPPLDAALRSKLIYHEIKPVRLAAMKPVGPYPTVVVNAGDADIGVSVDGNFSVIGRYDNEVKQPYSTGSFSRPLQPNQREYMKKLEFDPRQFCTPQQQITLPQAAGKRIDDLAEKWTKDLLEKRDANPDQLDDINLKIARRIAQKLRESYPYSLDLSESDPTRDGVEDFLFHLKKGHCEYFAAALGVMCCRLGVPARIATGFVLNEYDPDEQQYMVRGKDAHAWCEIYHPQKGWVLVDPTPGNDRIESMKENWWDKVKNFWAKMQFMWATKVVSYDSDTQRDIGDQTAKQCFAIWSEFLGFCRNIWDSFLKLLMEGVVDQALLDFFWWFSVCAGMAAIWLLVRRMHRVRKMQSDPAYIASLRKLPSLQKLLITMGRSGYPKSKMQTLREYMTAAAEKFSLPADILEKICDLQNRWRWGSKSPTHAELQEVQEHCKFLSEQLKGISKHSTIYNAASRDGH